MRLSETAIRQFVADWHEATISHDDEKLLTAIGMTTDVLVNRAVVHASATSDAAQGRLKFRPQ